MAYGLTEKQFSTIQEHAKQVISKESDFLYTLKHKAGVLKNLRFRDELVCSANRKIRGESF